MKLFQFISDGGSLKKCIKEMKSMLYSPIRAFTKPGTDPKESPTSPGAGSEVENTVQEGDLPGQFTRLMTKGIVNTGSHG